MRLALSALLAAVTAGAWPSPPPPRVYTVAYAPDVPLEVHVRVAEAQALWTASLPSGAVAWRHAEACSAEVICVHMASAAELGVLMNHPDSIYYGVTRATRSGHGDIWLSADSGLAPAQLRAVAAHELGHAMGLQHDASPRALMYYALSDQTGPTARDVRAWRAARAHAY